jgi:hypothetical protein
MAELQSSAHGPSRLSGNQFSPHLVNEHIISNPLIETLSQVILNVFARCGRITGKQEIRLGKEHDRPVARRPQLDEA